MNESGARPMSGYRREIVSSLTPVRPLLRPARRLWMIMPAGLVLAATAPLLNGGRGDLFAYGPLLTWGATGLQSLVGLWILSLGFREAVPGHNLSRGVLTLACALAGALVTTVTVLTNGASPTVVPAGREWRDWIECIAGPTILGAPFMIVTTLMAVRAFPTRPVVAGGLCGLAAGVLTDAGWRLTCWISAPSHIVESHALAMLGLAAAGSLVAVAADLPRWRRLRSRFAAADERR